MVNFTVTFRTHFLAIVAGFLFVTGGQLQAQTKLSDDQVKNLVEKACTQCHSLKPIQILRDGYGGWKDYVHEMIQRGAQIHPDEVEAVVNYLVQNYGPGMSPMKTGLLPPNAAVSNTRGSDKISLPEGQGKTLVEGRCQICHDLGRIVTVRRSKEDWQHIIENMITRGIPTSTQETEKILSYLTKYIGTETKK